MTPPASVVVVTYNSLGDIEPCLAALSRQQGIRGHEIVVVDNGSSDGTAAFVRRRFPKVRVVEQANVGFGGGNDRGVAESTGDVLVFVNPDTVPEPGFVAAMVDAVGAGNRIATAQVTLKTDPSKLNTAGHRLHFTGFGFVVGFRQPRAPPGPPVPTQGFSGAAFAVRRDDYQRLGGFDPDFFLYMEDTELSWRAHRAGVDIVLAPSAVVVHDYDLDVPASKVAYIETGRLLLLRKHLPWYLWLAYAPSLLQSELLAWARAVWLGRAGIAAKWRGLRDGWRRGIRRYPHLPRARPHSFASQAIPFGALSGWRTVAFLGWFVNLLYRLNTLAWFVRPRRSRILLPE